MAVANREHANVIKLTLKSDLKDLQAAVAKPGIIDVNVNTPISWLQLFLNLEIPLAGDYVVKGDNGEIVSQLTDTIHSFVNKFTRAPAKNIYSAKIMKKTMHKPPPKVKVPSPTKTIPTASPKRGKVAIAPIARGRGRPPGTKNAHVGFKKPVSKVKLPSKIVNFVGNGNAMETDDLLEDDLARTVSVGRSNISSSRSNGSSSTRSNDNGTGRINNDLNNRDETNNDNPRDGPAMSNRNQLDNDRDDMESLFSRATVRDPMGLPSSSGRSRPDADADAKSVVVESLVKNVTNSMLWRIKDEYDDLQRQGKWLRLCSTHIPQLGNLVADMFHDKHFQR